jgi:hypothetical protein
MTALEQLSSSLRDSEKIDPATRDLLLQFLAAGAPVLQSLEASALRALMTWLAGSATAAPPAVNTLDTRQVLALLDLTQSQMDATVNDRREQSAAARAALEALGQSALALLARFLIAAL